MNTYRTRKQLKQDAKNTLKGNWGKGILLFIFAIIYGYLVNSFNISMNFNNWFYGNGIHGSFWLIDIILSLAFVIMMTSADFRALDWIRNPELQFQPVQSNFTRFKNPDWYKILGMYIIVSVLTWLWSLLLLIPGIIKSFSYSQTYFIYKDLSDKGQSNGYSLTDFVTRSRQLMDGHKADYFVLQLSFLGWFILGFITAGIGFIWILPYYHLTMANFYRDLAENNPKLV